nr:sodium:solute symporter [Klebsiella aerogenes]
MKKCLETAMTVLFFSMMAGIGMTLGGAAAFGWLKFFSSM